jgi:hypothetical protein
VPDPRDRRRVRCPLAGILALAVTATMSGRCSFAAIGQWAAETTVRLGVADWPVSPLVEAATVFVILLYDSTIHNTRVWITSGLS